MTVRAWLCQESRATFRTRGLCKPARSAVPAASNLGSLGEVAATWNCHRPPAPPALRWTRVKVPAGVRSPVPSSCRLPDWGGKPARVPFKLADSRVTPWKDNFRTWAARFTWGAFQGPRTAPSAEREAKAAPGGRGRVREPDTEALKVTSTPDSVRVPRQEAVRPANCTSAREMVSFFPSKTKLAFRSFRGSFCTRPLAWRFPAR